MAAKRYRKGLANYRARTASSAFPKKRAPSPTSKAGRRQARAVASRGRLPAPGTTAARRRYNAYLPDTEEVRWLKKAALGETLSKAGPGPYARELDELAEAEYRKAYNAQQREKRAARPRAPSAGRARSPWIWVKRHRRKRPG